MREADIVEFFSCADDKPRGGYKLRYTSAHHSNAQYLITCLLTNDPDFAGGFVVGQTSAVSPEESPADYKLDTFFCACLLIFTN